MGGSVVIYLVTPLPTNPWEGGGRAGSCFRLSVITGEVGNVHHRLHHSFTLPWLGQLRYSRF